MTRLVKRTVSTAVTATLLAASLAVAAPASTATPRIAARQATNAMDEFRSWMSAHPDVIIERGWVEEERAFRPDGGTGPGPASIVLYTLAATTGNPEYLRIADALVDQELQDLAQTIEKLGLQQITADVRALLASWDPSQGTIEELKAAIMEIVSAGLENGIEQVFADDQWWYAVIGLPVLISGMDHYSGDPAVRARCEHLIEPIAAILSAALLANPDAVQEALDAAGIDYSVEVVGSQVAKYDALIAPAGGNAIFRALACKLADLMQARLWSAEENRYTGGTWDLPQLFEALGYAYEIQRNDTYPQRIQDTLAWLEANGEWNQWTDPADGATVGVYDKWVDGSRYGYPGTMVMDAYLSPVQLFLGASAKWVQQLRRSPNESDRAFAQSLLDRAIYMFRFCERVMLNPDNAIMDHDVILHQDDLTVTNRNRWECTIGCMQCNWSVVRSFLFLDALLRQTV
ncbi:MAG: hypothetical protein HYV63_18085 [Candidatus Schekmanbacteria bacterium]|nr:hypothetical protein [Candidatus Schekmanbacteria bacterium]